MSYYYKADYLLFSHVRLLAKRGIRHKILMKLIDFLWKVLFYKNFNLIEYKTIGGTDSKIYHFNWNE